MRETNIQIDESWKKVLQEEFEQEYFVWIRNFLIQEEELWKIIYPEWKDIFNAFNSTPFDDVKVVIIGQDPYHGLGQAHGLCFSVQKWVRQPPSLKNIFKEISSDLWWTSPDHWCLDKRAEQWVFLLNAILTVEARTPASHAKIWWQKFTDVVIKKLSEERKWLVFLLWWAYAQNKKILIDQDRHFILETTHPSPFSAHKWFLWSKHFSKTNEILTMQGKKEIDWSID